MGAEASAVGIQVGLREGQGGGGEGVWGLEAGWPGVHTWIYCTFLGMPVGFLSVTVVVWEDEGQEPMRGTWSS